MSGPSFRQGQDGDQGGVGHEWLGGGNAGKRAPTDAIQRKADGTSPPALATPGRDDTPAPTSGQSFVDSIVHGAVDPAKVAADQIAHGVHDENKITNEVFWALKPALRNDHLKAGSPDAAEWLRLRDEIVRPALAGHKEPKATHTGEVEGHDLARAHAVVPHADATPPSGDATVDALIADVPPNGSPNKVEAAWLLRAIAAGFVGAPGQTLPQLQQLAQGETALRTREKEPGAAYVQRGIAALEKQDIHVERIKSGEYSVDGGRLPVLRAMVDIVAGRIRQWVQGGKKGKRQLFWFGDMVRADAGFADYNDKAKKGKHTMHTSGNAIDLGGLPFDNDATVVAVLSGLDPGKIQQVFPDGGADGIVPHVHLALTDDDKYELGVPWSPAFFQIAEHLETAKAAAEKAAPPDAAEGATITAHGGMSWNPYWFESTATRKGNKWIWKDHGKGLARDHIKSGALRALLDRLARGTPPKVSKVAAKEDGVKPKTGNDHE